MFVAVFSLVLWQCWLGDRKGIQLTKTCYTCPQSSVQELMKEKTLGELANSGLLGNWPLVMKSSVYLVRIW